MVGYRYDAKSPIKLASSQSVRTLAGRVVLQGPVSAFVLRDPALARLAAVVVQRLDGTCTKADVLAAVAPEDAGAVEELLDLFGRFGLLDIEYGAVPEPVLAQLRLSSLLGLSPEVARTRMGSAVVLLDGAEPWADELKDVLARAGIGRVGRAAELADTVASGRTLLLDLTPFFASNERWAVTTALARGVPVLSACLRGPEILIGPLARLPGGPCGECLRNRMLACEDSLAPDQPELPSLHGEAAANFGAAATLAPQSTLAAGLVGTEIVRRILEVGTERADDAVEIWNALSGKPTSHRVIATPFCRTCGGAEIRTPERQPYPDASLWSGPEDVSGAFPGWVDTRTGIVARLFSDHVPPLHAVQAQLAHPHDGIRWLGVMEITGGKAERFGEAAIRAVAEALERYSAMVVNRATLLLRRLDAVDGEVIDPRHLCLYATEQYNMLGFPFVPFDPVLNHGWLRGAWVADGAPVWAPALAVHLAGAAPSESSWCQTTSNGLAAGATFTDAALRAILELLERDVLMTSWITRSPLCRVIPDGSLGALADALLAEAEDQGGAVTLHLDLSRPVAVAACFVRGDGVRYPGLTVGGGADVSPRAALCRAIVEQGVSSRRLRDRLRAGAFAPEKEAVRSFGDHALYYLPAARAAAAGFMDDGTAIPLAAVPEPPSMNLQALGVELAKVGVRIALIDITSPELRGGPFKVVRAIGPHLQPVFCGYGKHRLPGLRGLKLLKGRPPNSDLPPFS